MSSNSGAKCEHLFTTHAAISRFASNRRQSKWKMRLCTVAFTAKVPRVYVCIAITATWGLVEAGISRRVGRP